MLRPLKAFAQVGAVVRHGPALLSARTPMGVVFFDGVTRAVPRSTALLFSLWKLTSNLRRESEAVYEAYPGGDMIDVGAFHGWYSLLLAPKAKAGARFVSFEPDHGAFAALAGNLATAQHLFPGLGLTIESHACGTGAAVRPVYPLGRDAHAKIESSGTTSGDATGSRTIALDGYVALTGLRPSFVKVDVEGAEYHVLEGMQSLLAKFRPVLMIEVHPQWQPEGVTIDALRSFLQTRGYRIEAIDIAALSERWLAHPN